ncbi:MAG: NYN domain-containing protein [Deltaproteobacteria bacterium]|nr:NYN domain-containing protein [Deltaproteobacteria bacterium]
MPKKTVKSKVAPARKSAPVRKKALARKAAPPKRAAAAGRKRERPLRKAAVREPAARQPRRAIFIDVENTSSEADLMGVLDALKVDRLAEPTELTAVGNWKSVGQRLARHLAAMGVQLVHSAPATGVRDWSDLWIAVAAGCWLGTALPGDSLEVVSDDRAFDAVGDAAAARGVRFQRVSYRAAPAAAESPATAEGRRRRRRRGGRGRRAGETHTQHTAAPAAGAAPIRTVTAAVPNPPARAATAAATRPESAHEEAHAAPHAQIVAVLTRLVGGSSERWVNLDILANALKAEGFTRPPGSPRLVTRLRRMKDLEVSPNGMVRLAGAAPGAQSDAAP